MKTQLPSTVEFQDVQIALVGKYTQLEDAYASVIKALNHASLACNYRLRLTYIPSADLEEEAKISNPVQFHEAWKKLCECQGNLDSSYKIFLIGNFQYR